MNIFGNETGRPLCQSIEKDGKILTAVEQVDCNSSHILHRKSLHMVLHKPEKTGDNGDASQD